MKYTWIIHPNTKASVKASPVAIAKTETGTAQRINTRQDIVRQAITYIDTQYMELRDLREIAQTMGYSYSYVSHVFREEMGLSLQAYYTNKKLKKAMHILASQPHSVTRVAELLRYQSIHSFSKAFKKFTGLTPTEFQQQQSKREKISIR